MNLALRRFARQEELVIPPGLDGVLDRARARDPQALAALVQGFAPRVYGLLYRLTGSRETAEDLTQETFLRVVRTIAEYEHSGKFEIWLFRIAGNLARDLRRQTRRRGVAFSLHVSDADEAIEHVNDRSARAGQTAAALTGAEEHDMLRACLDRLPDLDREIVLLRHFSELSFREIADMLGIPLGTALARAHRALGRLKDELGTRVMAEE